MIIGIIEYSLQAFFIYIREGFKKKNCEKAVRLTAWVDPPLPSPEAVRKMWKFLDKLPYLGLFCRFIKDKNGSKFSQIEVVRLRGGGAPPPPPPPPYGHCPYLINIFFLRASLTGVDHREAFASNNSLTYFKYFIYRQIEKVISSTKYTALFISSYIVM